jgi:hypothetical protein
MTSLLAFSLALSLLALISQSAWSLCHAHTLMQPWRSKLYVFLHRLRAPCLMALPWGSEMLPTDIAFARISCRITLHKNICRSGGIAILAFSKAISMVVGPLPMIIMLAVMVVADRVCRSGKFSRALHARLYPFSYPLALHPHLSLSLRDYASLSTLRTLGNV